MLARWTNHVKDILDGRHTNNDLVRDVLNYGLKNFKVEIIEKCANDLQTLLILEHDQIVKYYKDGYDLYNRIPKNADWQIKT